jgi:hypothetical protein
VEAPFSLGIEIFTDRQKGGRRRHTRSLSWFTRSSPDHDTPLDGPGALCTCGTAASVGNTPVADARGQIRQTYLPSHLHTLFRDVQF